MEKQLLEEVIACLPTGRTLFHYHRDRYTLYLLERLCRRGLFRTVAELKRSPYASWLDKPLLKNAGAALGCAQASVQDLLITASSCAETNPYILTLGQWGSESSSNWYQTSRPGMNLVLHLNLPMTHITILRDLGIRNQAWLQRYWHPNSQTRVTLAWARIDLDFATGEALIEEIQSDWTRDMAALIVDARQAREKGRKQVKWNYWMEMDIQKVLDYEQVLQAQYKLWSEAMLAAALWFLFDELGIHEVYYHSWMTGKAVIRMYGKAAPPRSLYTDLPERFFFSRRDHGPAFLESSPKLAKIRRRQKEWLWYHWAA